MTEPLHGFAFPLSSLCSTRPLWTASRPALCEKRLGKGITLGGGHEHSISEKLPSA